MDTLHISVTLQPTHIELSRHFWFHSPMILIQELITVDAEKYFRFVAMGVLDTYIYYIVYRFKGLLLKFQRMRPVHLSTITQ